MIELKTPFEIIEELSMVIEKTRKKRNLRQKDLCKNAGVSISTYQTFLYDKKINIVNLVKIMYALDMNRNLEQLISYDEIESLDDIKKAKKKKLLPQRVRLKNDE